VNKQWVAELENQVSPPWGSAAATAIWYAARKLDGRVKGNRKDLGFVGRPHKVKTTVLEIARRGGMIPVVASLG